MINNVAPVTTYNPKKGLLQYCRLSQKCIETRGLVISVQHAGPQSFSIRSSHHVRLVETVMCTKYKSSS